MFTRSISRTEAAPTPMLTARWRIFTTRRSRSAPLSCLESSTPGMARWSGGMTTAHATTGPASGPRPTSSTPAMNGPTMPRSSRSIGFHRSRAMGRVPSRPLLGGGSSRLGHAHLLFADARGLTGEIAEVVELCAAHTAAAHYYDLGEHRAVHREDALDADAVGNLAHGEGLAHTSAATSDANALEGLNALLFAFTDADVHPQGVAGTEAGDVSKPLFLGFDECMHMTLVGRGRPGKDEFGGRLGK